MEIVYKERNFVNHQEAKYVEPNLIYLFSIRLKAFHTIKKIRSITNFKAIFVIRSLVSELKSFYKAEHLETKVQWVYQSQRYSMVLDSYFKTV